MSTERNQLYIWQGRVLFATRDNVAEPHGHFACSILIGLDGDFTVTPDTGVERGFRAVVLAPNVYHRMDGSGTRLVILQIDPDFPDYRPLEKMLAEHEDPLLGLDYGIFEPLLERFTGLFSGDYDCDRARLLYDDIITTITHVPHREVVLDPRIREVLGRLKTEEPDTVSVPELARGVGLSADRFMHLFKENMGLPVRKYLLWLKLQRAARAMKSGANLTRAAHEAGFSDSAHLSRTFKDMFGLSPSRVLANQRETRVNYCHEEGEGEDAHAPGYPS